MIEKNRRVQLPETEEIAKELKRERYKNQYSKTFRYTIDSILIVLALTVLVATLWLPVFRVYGTSMNPTLQEGDVVLCASGKNYKPGQVVVLYAGNKVLVKRIIAMPGQVVEMKDDGAVIVDGETLNESYVEELQYGVVNIEFPYEVPKERYFVLGDVRSNSSDSRNTAVGCIAEEQIAGKVILRIWPLNRFGLLQE